MKTVLLKLSGEILGSSGFDPEKASLLADQVIEANRQADTRLAIVFGGGNIWRGRDFESFGFPAAESDGIGMMATILNAAVFQRVLRAKGAAAVIFSPLAVPFLAEPHVIEKEKQCLDDGTIVLFAGGTGAPFFTTDSAAVLRALEIGADFVLKGTKVPGIYSADPLQHPDAEWYSEVTYDEAIDKGLKVMDATAFALASGHRLPLFVFDVFEPGAIGKAIAGKAKGSWVR